MSDSRDRNSLHLVKPPTPDENTWLLNGGLLNGEPLPAAAEQPDHSEPRGLSGLIDWRVTAVVCIVAVILMGMLGLLVFEILRPPVYVFPTAWAAEGVPAPVALTPNRLDDLLRFAGTVVLPPLRPEGAKRSPPSRRPAASPAYRGEIEVAAPQIGYTGCPPSVCRYLGNRPLGNLP